MKWTVGTKIGLGFGIISLIFVIVAATSYYSTLEFMRASEMRRHTYEVLAQLRLTLSLLTDVETSQRGYVIVGEERYLEPYRDALTRLDSAVRDVRRLTADNERQQRRLDVLERVIKDRLAHSRAVIEARRTKGFDPAAQLTRSGRGKGLMEEIRDIVGQMEDEENGLLSERTAAATANARETQMTIVLGTLLALVLAGLSSFLITRNIAKPLGVLTAVAERVTMGDLNINVPVESRRDEVGVLARALARMTMYLRSMATTAEQIAAGELRLTASPQSAEDQLGNAFARMVANLREQIRALVESTNVLGAAASEIVASTTQLAATATQSAAAVSETTITVEEVRQTAQLASQKSKYVSENAQRAAQTAHTGRKSAEDVIGGMSRIRQQMETIAASMAELSEQGHSIGQIIAVVEDLSVQSNLLAVNAAIEAAKAGEHGKGFGVVAQEVKSLAEQSRQATNQVRTILSDIQKATGAAVMAAEQGHKAVEAGDKQTGLAGESIQALAGNVADAAQVATQIAASSQQQLVGMDQVAAAMENIKQASAQNVASAKQLESAAHNLSELGAKVKHVVNRYNV